MNSYDFYFKKELVATIHPHKAIIHGDADTNVGDVIDGLRSLIKCWDEWNQDHFKLVNHSQGNH